MAGPSPSALKEPAPSHPEPVLTLRRMCAKYSFEKPNDKRALDLMNSAAKAVVGEIHDITLAYGVSDEYSFVFHKSSNLFERRAR